MKKLIVSTINQFRIIAQSNILLCKSDDSYTKIFLINGEEILICKSLAKVSSQLDSLNFIRVNQSYLINKDFIECVDKKNKYIELIDKRQIPFTITIRELLLIIS
jgi:DNA-binding LytR/AlgR family response regulator